MTWIVLSEDEKIQLKQNAGSKNWSVVYNNYPKKIYQLSLGTVNDDLLNTAKKIIKSNYELCINWFEFINKTKNDLRKQEDFVIINLTEEMFYDLMSIIYEKYM